MNTDSVARQRPRRHDGRGASELAVFAATEHLLQETTLEKITVAQIITRAKLSRANFYHYFASKYDVIAAMVLRLVENTENNEGPLHAELGLSHKAAMEEDLRRTVHAWSEHSAFICAVIEHIHVVPQLAAAWDLMINRFVAALVEQIGRGRETSTAADGAPPELIATVLFCGYERTFYVGARAYDTRLPDPTAAVDSLIHMTLNAVYGELASSRKLRRHGSRSSRKPAPGAPESVVVGTEPLTDAVRGGGDPKSAAAILRATRTLLEEGSLDQLTVAKILEAAEISRATFYFYFENKDDVFLALFQTIADEIVGRFRRLTTIDRRDTGQIRVLVTHWLDLAPADFAVLRNAIHEWPHRPRLRAAYSAALAQMTDTLEAAIESDRAARLALDGPPAPQLAAVLIWTIERSIAGSLAGEANLADTRAVAAFLAEMLVATIYGR